MLDGGQTSRVAARGRGLFRLADGEMVDLRGDEFRAIFDMLWMLEEEPGAVLTAALLLHEWRRGMEGREAVELDERESAVFRLARSRLAEKRGAS